MGVSEIKYFESRLQPALWKILISIAVTIINDLVMKIKKHLMSLVYQMLSFVKYFNLEKGKSDIVFIDCSHLLSYSTNASPTVYAIGSCLIEKFKELNLEVAEFKAFVSDELSAMTGPSR